MQRSNQLGPQLDYEHDTAEHFRPVLLSPQTRSFSLPMAPLGSTLRGPLLLMYMLFARTACPT